jgi:energy-coupling factor transporter ATP-binding protein EcfA2
MQDEHQAKHFALPPMIHFHDVSFAYPECRKVFDHLTLEIERGAWVLATGPDGSGKTTFCKLLKGLLVPDSGQIIIDDKRESDCIGYLGGDPYDSLVGISVEDDVIFGLENLRLSPKEIEVRLLEALDQTGMLPSRNRSVQDLSGGEQQRLALAGVIAMRCTILVLDEAFNMLDNFTALEFRRLIDHLRLKQHITVVECSYRPQMPADHVVFFRNHSIIEKSSLSKFLRSETGMNWGASAGGIEALERAIVLRSRNEEVSVDAIMEKIAQVKDGFRKK